MKPAVSGIVLSGLCALLAGLGCSKQPAPNFVAARIGVFGPTDTLFDASTTKTITNPQDVKRLASFFPHLGEGKSSSNAAPSVPYARIDFFESNGQCATVIFESQFEAWSEGRGDWRLSAEFRPYFLELMKEQ
ncbi:unnamed protein product [marine sediment metagenome]|uniref:Lipoprotein n=1 Tax=marine sediment metagenome TaxID=412755 RepID=X0T1E1_9ZZZZ